MLSRLAIVCTVLVAAGCGGEAIKLASVSGTVTMDDKPLPRVYVNFQPIGTADNPNPGRGSSAVTDDKGRFTLQYDGKQNGAVVGRHRVTITPQFQEDLGGTPDTGTPDGVVLPRLGKAKPIPERYNVQSDLTFEVLKGGTDKADFPLTSSKR